MTALHRTLLAAIALLLAPSSAFPAEPDIRICDTSTDAATSHLPWCADRPNVPCHESVASCERLRDTVAAACRNTYQVCYVRFAKVSDKAACEQSLRDFRTQLDGLACNWPRRPEPKVGVCGGQDYVVYDDVVKIGGRPTWRNNNPGALTCLEKRADYGAYATCGSFAIFPDLPTGAHALLQWLTANGQRSILQFAETHAPRPNGAKLNEGNDPDAYAAKIVDELRRDNPTKSYGPGTLLGSLSQDELGTVVRAVTMQEGSTNPANQGKTYDRDKPGSMPAALRGCLGL